MSFMSYLSVPLIGMPGWQELIIIGVVVALLFGARKLPQLGKGLGEGIRNFKKGIKGESKGDQLAESETDDEPKKDAEQDS